MPPRRRASLPSAGASPSDVQRAASAVVGGRGRREDGASRHVPGYNDAAITRALLRGKKKQAERQDAGRGALPDAAANPSREKRGALPDAAARERGQRRDSLPCMAGLTATTTTTTATPQEEAFGSPEHPAMVALDWSPESPPPPRAGRPASRDGSPFKPPGRSAATSGAGYGAGGGS